MNLLKKSISEYWKSRKYHWAITDIVASKEQRYLLGLGQLLSQAGLTGDSLIRTLFSSLFKGQILKIMIRQQDQSVQSFSCVWFFVTPWTTARQAPRPSPTTRVHPNPCSLSRWCHPTISSSVVPFSSCPQSFSASVFFQMSQLFLSGGRSIGVSASTSVLPMNTQDWPALTVILSETPPLSHCHKTLYQILCSWDTSFFMAKIWCVSFCLAK